MVGEIQPWHVSWSNSSSGVIYSASLPSQNLGEQCWKQGMQAVTGDGTYSQTKQQYQTWMLETLPTSGTSLCWGSQLHMLIPEGKSEQG